MYIKKYFKTAQTALRARTNGGLFYLLPGIVIKIIYLIPLMFLWWIIVRNGADAGMSLPRLMSYTYVNALISDQLVVNTFLTGWDFYDGCTGLFIRPATVFGQVISRTAGEWIPSLLMFTLPMSLLAPLLGIRIIPETLWFYPSLFMCISLGFAFEFLFYCVTVRLRNVAWLTMVIRSAVVSFFSGTVIPFRILPFGLDGWMWMQPFGSLGGAPLSLLTGAAEPLKIIAAQVFWNIATWLAAAVWFKKSRERMVSFGG